MKAAVQGIAPFDLMFKGVGAFPKQDQPRVIWIGIEAPGSLATIAARLEEGCADLGFKKEDRPFSPHLTLSRVKFIHHWRGLPDFFKAFHDKDFGKVRVERIRLKKSVLGLKGPTYTTVGEVLLNHESA
jgi:2'-5' RNA ligase